MLVSWHIVDESLKNLEVSVVVWSLRKGYGETATFRGVGELRVILTLSVQTKSAHRSWYCSQGYILGLGSG